MRNENYYFMIKTELIFIFIPVFYYTEHNTKRNCAGNQAEKNKN
jgi:hypothetical protein